MRTRINLEIPVVKQNFLHYRAQPKLVTGYPFQAQTNFQFVIAPYTFLITPSPHVATLPMNG